MMSMNQHTPCKDMFPAAALGMGILPSAKAKRAARLPIVQHAVKNTLATGSISTHAHAAEGCMSVMDQRFVCAFSEDFPKVAIDLTLKQLEYRECFGDLAHDETDARRARCGIDTRVFQR